MRRIHGISRDNPDTDRMSESQGLNLSCRTAHLVKHLALTALMKITVMMMMILMIMLIHIFTHNSYELLSENKPCSLNSTYNFCALKNLQLRFQEKNVNPMRDSNLGSPDH